MKGRQRNQQLPRLQDTKGQHDNFADNEYSPPGSPGDEGSGGLGPAYTPPTDRRTRSNGSPRRQR